MSSADHDESLPSPDQLLSDPDELPDMSSDEFPEMPLMRTGTFPKENHLETQPSHQEDSGDAARRGLPRAPEPLQSSPLSASAKKIQSLVCGKGGGCPSYSPQATPGMNVPQEMKLLVAKKVVLKRKSQDHHSGGPLGPAVSSAVSCVLALGRAEKYTLIPSGSKEPTFISAKKRLTIKTRECELVAGGDNPNREPAPKGYLSTNKARRVRLFFHRGGSNSGDPKTRAFQVSGSSLLLTVVQGDVKPKVPPLSGDQEPLLHPPRKERKQPLPETYCCPRCPVLLKEIDHLKDQLAAMQCLTDKFNML